MTVILKLQLFGNLRVLSEEILTEVGGTVVMKMFQRKVPSPSSYGKLK